MSLNHRMAEVHETWLVEVLGGRKTRGSGNQWNNPMDGRANRYNHAVAFAWDGKSTRGKSISITLAMIDKAEEQALGERPLLALRWYDDDRCTKARDWFAIPADDLLELLEIAAQAGRMKALVREVRDGERTYVDTYGDSALYLFAREVLGED